MKRPPKLFVILLPAAVIVWMSGQLLGCGKPASKKASTKQTREGQAVSIPENVLNSKFGFLSGDPSEAGRIKEMGGSWARPHPGPFLWDSMQISGDQAISFMKTDRLVKEYQEAGIGLLITLWPFADWDQKQKDDASSHMVSENDEFLPRSPGGPPFDMDYLPRYRGNPNDWQAYNDWVTAVVERYDGDGKSDMPGLKIPVKYWEVMNEPDLAAPKGAEDEGRLDFYTEDPRAYQELLIKTSSAIKEADNQAKVLIAGAAGGNEQFLDFYKQVLTNQQAASSFDIANVHCISNDNYESFNVEPYQKMLQEMGASKPVWVTEAEAIVSADEDINATQTLHSANKALDLGAQKIFFTRPGFSGQGKPPMPGKQTQLIEPEISGSDPVEAYKTITGH